jgi:hypothetical protein
MAGWNWIGDPFFIPPYNADTTLVLHSDLGPDRQRCLPACLAVWHPRRGEWEHEPG